MKYHFLFFILFSNSSFAQVQTTVKSDCNENLTFKKYFFDQITRVEKYTYGYINDPTLRNNDTLAIDLSWQSFMKSIEFIGKYAPVSENDILQYHAGYNTLYIYEADKEGWIKWYNEHKCNNIQFLD